MWREDPVGSHPRGQEGQGRPRGRGRGGEGVFLGDRGSAGDSDKGGWWLCNATELCMRRGEAGELHVVARRSPRGRARQGPRSCPLVGGTTAIGRCRGDLSTLAATAAACAAAPPCPPPSAAPQRGDGVRDPLSTLSLGVGLAHVPCGGAAGGGVCVSPHSAPRPPGAPTQLRLLSRGRRRAGALPTRPPARPSAHTQALSACWLRGTRSQVTTPATAAAFTSKGPFQHQRSSNEDRVAASAPQARPRRVGGGGAGMCPCRRPDQRPPGPRGPGVGGARGRVHLSVLSSHLRFLRF